MVAPKTGWINQYLRYPDHARQITDQASLHAAVTAAIGGITPALVAGWFASAGYPVPGRAWHPFVGQRWPQ